MCLFFPPAAASTCRIKIETYFRTYYIRAKNQMDQERWINALKIAVQEAEKDKVRLRAERAKKSEQEEAGKIKQAELDAKTKSLFTQSSGLSPSHSKVCRRCSQQVSKNAVQVEDMVYHAECFTCNRCKAPLKKYVTMEDGKEYCLNCESAVVLEKEEARRQKALAAKESSSQDSSFSKSPGYSASSNSLNRWKKKDDSGRSLSEVSKQEDQAPEACHKCKS